MLLHGGGDGGGGIVGVSLLVIEFFLVQTSSVCIMYVGDQFVGVDCFSLYAECFVVFGVFFVFLNPSSECCMWD